MTSSLAGALTAAGLPPARRVGDHAERLDGAPLDGASAADWLARQPQAAPEIAAALGEALRRLWSVRLPPDHRWPAHWAARRDAQRREALARRLHLGPPLEIALADAPAPGIAEMVPVHGDLDLDRLWLGPSLAPVALLGGEQAFPGDGGLDLAAAMRLGDPALRLIVAEAAGVGPGDARRWAPYLPGDLLTHLLRAPAHPRERALHLERVRLRLDELADGDVLTAPPRREPDHPVIAARQALEASADDATGPSWLGALGAALLAAGLPSGLGARFGLVAVELAGRVEPPSSPGSPHAGARFLADRAVALLDGAVGPQVVDGLRSCSADGPVAEALSRAAQLFEQPPIALGLPPELLVRVVDDPLVGDRASLPAVAWASHLIATRGCDSEGRGRLISALDA